MAKIGRNDRCPCGSGKKYKQCCLAKDEAADRSTFLAAPAADHLPHHHPRLCKDCNAEIDDAANAVTALIDAGKFDDAEHAARQMVERWPACMTATTASAWSIRSGGTIGRPSNAIARSSPSPAKSPISTIPSSRTFTGT